jgi:uncharacterized membrane protein HdeD (DUF308 family)
MRLPMFLSNTAIDGTQTTRHELTNAVSADGMPANWGWFVALGIALMLVGMLAFSNVFLATLVTVFYIGILMLVGGIAHVIAAFRVRKWGSFFFWIASGALYGVAGALAFYNPLAAASALTLVVAAMMFVAGILRIAIGVRERPHGGWGWIVASGAVTLLFGIVIALGWPMNTAWFLGLMLAIDLLVQGAASLALGLALRKRARSALADAR